LLPCELVWTEARVAIEDCEFDLVGLPGRTENVGAGDGCEGGGMIGEVFINDGEAVAVGVGTGVVLDDEGAVRVLIDIEG
jgi:hypothetical protein